MKILIVGGGPAGVATGLLLARAGIDVHVIEREPDLARTFRGEGLMPSGLDALLQTGLGDLLDGLPSRIIEAPGGGRLPVGDTGWAEVLGAPAPEDLADHIARVAGAIEGPTRLRILVGRADRWSAPGILLLGDAAHPMSPVRAQGINLALRDAIVAANHLVPAARSPGALDDAARRVQTERQPEIVRAQRLQYRDTRFWGTRWAPLFIGLAGTIGPLVGRYGWAQRAWRDQQKALWFGSGEVRLRV